MKGLIKNEKGASLIEVLVAVAIIGLVAVAFLSALATSSKTIIIADERTTSESLARSQMEYVKDFGYEVYDYVDGSPVLPLYTKDNEESATHPGYFIWIDAFPIDPDTGDPLINLETGEFLIDLDTGDPYYDDGIQEITVTVSHNGEVVIILEGYKVNR